MYELIGYWSALALYGVGFVIAAFALVLNRERVLGWAGVACLVGFMCHAGALVGRGLWQWAPPFITYYESVSFGTWLAMGMFLSVAYWQRWILPAIVVLSPLNLLLMGSAMFSYREFESLAPGLQSWWLVVHVLFALLAFGCMTVAAAVSGMIVFFNRSAWAPAPSRGDSLLFRAFSLAFIFQMVMVASGSIWANQAWGRFWGWDPIETFSLLTLIVYGAAIHLRLMFNWRGKRLAWLSLVGFGLTVYGIWGVPMVSPSVHLYQGPEMGH